MRNDRVGTGGAPSKWSVWKLLPTITAAALLLAACGGGTSASKQPTTGGTLTIDNESGGLWTCGFNPFNAAVNFLSFGPVYEPLVYNNLLNDKKTPMLASGYQWSDGNKTLTFTIRDGVKWSDGQPFSADDVVYTFNLIKQTTALDLQSVWSVLSDVSKQGTNQVVMKFSQQAVPYFYYISGQVAIVAQHVWTSVKDPTTYDDKAPIGTGPFTIDPAQCTGQNIAYTRNASYWQHGLPYLEKVNYPAFTSNDTANAFLATGGAEWGGQFIPNIDAFYVAKDKAHNNYWFPPIANVDLMLNQKVKPLDNKLVRQALAFAIDRQRASTIGEYGYEPPGNQTGIVQPTFTSWYDPAQASKYGYTHDTAKAISLLQQAGYGPSHPLTLHVINIGSYSDWVATLQVVQANFKDIGVALKVDNLSNDDYNAKLFNGQFQLAYYGTTGGPSPYYEYKNTLFSGNSAPIGQTASGNYERWESTDTDNLLNAYAATTDSAEQHRIIGQIQGIMLENVPVIPVTESVAWYQYSTKTFTGWPTKNDQYAAPAPWNYPDWEQVLLRLHQS